MLIVSAFSLSAHEAHAQGFLGTAVATSVIIVENVRDGNVVSYDEAAKEFVLSRGVGDERVVGVVTLDPVLHLTSDTAVAGATPIARSGEARILVSTEAGAVRAGDYVTASDRPGIGMRAPRDRNIYVLGIALEDMVLLGDDEGGDGSIGLVPVMLRVGFTSAEDSSASATPVVVATPDKPEPEQLPESGVDLMMLLRYLIAAAVAFGAVVIALRSFGGSLSQSIISVGRNPLAKSSITSMLVWNSILIVVVSGLGLAIGAAIILLPFS